MLTVDIAIREGDKVILVKRKFEPFKGWWALPGGFVDVGETLEQAAIREAKEEISLDIHIKGFLGCYSEPDRDPRMHVVSAVYVAEAKGVPIAADDAATVGVFRMNDLPRALAFDHRQILTDYGIHGRD